MKKITGKKLRSQLNGGRRGQGLLRGLGPFTNLLMDERVGMAQPNNVGLMGMGGNSTTIVEALAGAQTMAVFTSEIHYFCVSPSTAPVFSRI